MAGPYRYIAAMRAALLADATLSALGIEVQVGYPWGPITTQQKPTYPRICLWSEADNEAVTLPETADPARVRVDAYSQIDQTQVAQVYGRVRAVLHKREQAITIPGDVVVKECRQVWSTFPVWDAKLSAWCAPARFLVRAMTLE